MISLQTYYSAAYAPDGAKRFARLSVAAEHLAELGLCSFTVPGPFDPSRLHGLHSGAYLEAFDKGLEPLASSQGVHWSPGIRDAVYAMLSGQLAAVEHALRNRVAFNLACGFHHAVPERGSAYCALNGLALAAHAMPNLRVFVIDCDEHGGNGTEQFCARMPNLFQASVFGTRFGCRGGDRSWAFHVAGPEAFEQYLEALEAIKLLLIKIRPDVILYQAGADCHVDDPKSLARITEDQMYERDLRVFNIARVLDIPIAFVVAGGYQAPQIVANLNANSVRAALEVFGSSAAGVNVSVSGCLG